jgi:hypothetical protein
MGRKPKIVEDDLIKPPNQKDIQEINKRIKQRVDNWDHERNRSKTTGEKS